jgi:hypothetical protein
MSIFQKQLHFVDTLLTEMDFIKHQIKSGAEAIPNGILVYE